MLISDLGNTKEPRTKQNSSVMDGSETEEERKSRLKRDVGAMGARVVR